MLHHKNFQHTQIVTSASEKVGRGLSPVLKVGDLSPCSPLLRRLCFHGFKTPNPQALRALRCRHGRLPVWINNLV